MSARYRLDKEVGRGAFAAVYLGIRLSDGERVAVKQVLRKYHGVGDKKFSHGVDWTALREIKILQEINHDNIVRVCSLLFLVDIFLDF